MSGITTGVGLISGIDTASLIDQLMAIEARPKILAQSRLVELQNEQAAFLGLNNLILSLETAAGSFADDSLFSSKTATSSDPETLTASAGSGAPPGIYRFIVDRLVSTHQVLSKGFASVDEQPLDVDEVSFEVGAGFLDPESALADLNGGAGVKRGTILVTDASGASAEIDLSTAATIGDVLDAINENDTVDVEARVDGDGLVLENRASGSVTFSVQDVGDGTTASDLGIAASDDDDDDLIAGSDINRLFGALGLGRLNDDTGIHINSAGEGTPDFSIVDGNGETWDIKLGAYTDTSGDEDVEIARVSTLQDVIDRIEADTEGNVTASIADDGTSLVLTDETKVGGTLELLGGGSGGSDERTLEDLGFTAGVYGSGDPVEGRRVLAGLNSVLVRALNGGDGLSGNDTLTINDRNGVEASITLDSDASLSEIVEQINRLDLDVRASYNATGNGLRIEATSGSGNLAISGNAASALGIEADVADDVVEGSNLQHQYVRGSTLLADLNQGRGVAQGRFRIYDALGSSVEIDIGSSERTVDDVIREINSLADVNDVQVEARINDTGDGILIESTATEPGSAIRVEATSGSTAEDLNILGTADADDLATENRIDGSFESRIELDDGDTLEDLVEKINGAGIDVSASIISDGSSATPFRLSITSERTGSAGRLAIDTNGLDLGLSTIEEGRDAVAFYGSDDPTEAILVRSSTNSLDGVVKDTTIDLLQASGEPVTVTIAEDTDAVVEGANEFVTKFNDVLKRIRELGRYDAETEEKGILLGDGTLRRIETQLLNTVQGSARGIEGEFDNLAQVGIRLGGDGLLTIDEERFREAYAEDPDAVEELFSAKELAEDQDIVIGDGITIESDELIYDSLGIMEIMRELADDLTNSVDGTLTVTDENYDDRIALQEDRIEQFDAQLEAKRARYEAEFAAMELALAELQQQQQALAGLVPVTG